MKHEPSPSAIGANSFAPMRGSRAAESTECAAKAVLLLVVIALAGCAGSDGLTGSSMTISDCMDPASADSWDIRRNLAAIRGTPLCYRRQEVREGPYRWVFHILEHRQALDGPFWVLPHDNEDTGFDVAVQGVITYGGGLLAVDSGGRRTFLGQDPNRNFSTSPAESRLCRNQRRAAPGYTKAVLDHYRGRRGPYLALHNNHDGWQGNGGSGTISLHSETAVLRAFPSARAEGQLRDEDNLVFMAGSRPLSADPAARQRVSDLNAAGLNVMYKQVDDRSFDCSLSDYVARHRLGAYYNLEAQYGHRQAQQTMLDRLMQILGIKPLRRAVASPFLGGG